MNANLQIFDEPTSSSDLMDFDNEKFDTKDVKPQYYSKVTLMDAQGSNWKFEDDTTITMVEFDTYPKGYRIQQTPIITPLQQ